MQFQFNLDEVSRMVIYFQYIDTSTEQEVIEGHKQYIHCYLYSF